MAAPSVSLVVPTYNEAANIEHVLDDALAQTARPNELLLVDNDSTDSTVEMARAHRIGQQIAVRILRNPRRGCIAGSLNLALASAEGDILVRWDGHSRYPPTYIGACLEIFDATPAACVGGRQVCVGHSAWGRSIAWATSSVFGVGAAPYKTTPGGGAREADTVYLGAYRTDPLRALGGWNEKWLVNEDYELNVRLREAGRSIVFDPRIHALYSVRSTLGALVRQQFRYGYWRARTVRAHPHTMSLRLAAPPALVLVIALSLLLAIGATRWALAPIILYLAAQALVASRPVEGTNFGRRLASLLGLHVPWGVGFLCGFGRP